MRRICSSNLNVHSNSVPSSVRMYTLYCTSCFLLALRFVLCRRLPEGGLLPDGDEIGLTLFD